MPIVSTSMPNGISASSQLSHTALLSTAKNSSRQSAHDPSMMAHRPPAIRLVTRPRGRLLRVNKNQMPAMTAVPPSQTISIHFQMANGLRWPSVAYRKKNRGNASAAAIRLLRCNGSMWETFKSGAVATIAPAHDGTMTYATPVRQVQTAQHEQRN